MSYAWTVNKIIWLLFNDELSRVKYVKKSIACYPILLYNAMHFQLQAMNQIIFLFVFIQWILKFYVTNNNFPLIIWWNMLTHITNSLKFLVSYQNSFNHITYFKYIFPKGRQSEQGLESLCTITVERSRSCLNISWLTLFLYWHNGNFICHMKQEVGTIKI